VTVLRRDIAEPEPIQGGNGWTTYDAPTRPAGPNPLARNGHSHDRAGRNDQPRVEQLGTGQQRVEQPRSEQLRGEQARPDQQRAEQHLVEQPRVDLPRVEQQVADVEPIELVGQVSRVPQAERMPQIDRAPVSPLPVSQVPVDRIVAERIPTERIPAERMPLERMPVGQMVPAGGTEPGPIEQLERLQSAELGLADSSKLIRLHESIAGLLASRGEWRQAYQHLRSALDLVYSDRIEQPPVPEQLRREVDRLRREHAEAREQSIRDSLTASYNRRYLDQRLTSLLADTAATNARDGLAVALVDLDWFKQVNDTFGHLVGDRVLQRVVELLSDGLPDGAFCARYGGEEFVLVVPGIDAATAVAVAEAARARVEHNAWSQLVPGLRVTVSVGLAHQPAAGAAAGRPPTSAEQQLLRADGLLYAAKQSGRNAVAYRHTGRVLLAGAAADRRRIAEPRAAVTPER
jgi:diguanylate cyclase (GGDEF)-like protein